MLFIVGSQVKDMLDLHIRRQEAVMDIFIAQVITGPAAYPELFLFSEPGKVYIIVAGDKQEVFRVGALGELRWVPVALGAQMITGPGANLQEIVGISFGNPLQVPGEMQGIISRKE